MTSLVKGVVFITGAGSGKQTAALAHDSNHFIGIGQYAAYALARYGIRHIAISDIKLESLDQTERELKKNHSDIDILKIQVDTSIEDSVNSAIDQTISKYGRIDIAINNAGEHSCI